MKNPKCAISVDRALRWARWFVGNRVAITTCRVFSCHAAPAFQHMQAELGFRQSFREIVRLIELFLPCSAKLSTVFEVAWIGSMVDPHALRIHLQSLDRETGEAHL